MYVVITRQGYGDFWRFKTYNAADESPLFQFGDAICHSGESVARQFNRLEMPGLLTRLGYADRARKMEAEFSDLSAVERDHKLIEYGNIAWHLLEKAAVEPPSDPETICAIVTKDRRKTKHKDFVMAKAKKAQVEGDQVDGAEGDAPAKEKKPRATSARTKVADDMRISLLTDAEGNQYGPEKNPKRPGTESHVRFAKYVDGMTVKEALEAGLKRDDITWDVNKKYISLSAA
jgi:hypothetical protein